MALLADGNHRMQDNTISPAPEHFVIVVAALIGSEEEEKSCSVYLLVCGVWTGSFSYPFTARFLLQFVQVSVSSLSVCGSMCHVRIMCINILFWQDLFFVLKKAIDD